MALLSLVEKAIMVLRPWWMNQAWSDANQLMGLARARPPGGAVEHAGVGAEGNSRAGAFIPGSEEEFVDSVNRILKRQSAPADQDDR